MIPWLKRWRRGPAARIDACAAALESVEYGGTLEDAHRAIRRLSAALIVAERDLTVAAARRRRTARAVRRELYVTAGIGIGSGAWVR